MLQADLSCEMLGSIRVQKILTKIVTGCSILRIFRRSNDDFFHVVPGSSMRLALLVWGGGSQLQQVVHNFGLTEPIQGVLTDN